MINNDTTHNEVTHKYLLKTFNGRTNNNKYKSQILKHNIYYTNVIAIQDTILMPKVVNSSDTKKQPVINTLDIEVMQICNTTNVLLKYN